MNEVKLVHGAAGKRTFTTPAKQAELKRLEEQRKQERTDRFVNEWFTFDEDEPLTKSDVAMSIGFYIGLPLMVVATALGAMFV